MLFREDTGGDGVVAVPQPSHAWLAGQLLRAWGNHAFPTPSPREDVCLGAELHDIGWLSWEAAPTLNPATGRPHNFMDLGPAVHTPLWRDGVLRALAFGRYPALVVSLHANTIYGTFFDAAKATPEDAAIVRRFLEEQRRFQEDCVAALQGHPRYADDLTPEALERNRLLVGAVDRLSLELCWGVEGEAVIPNVPRVSGSPKDIRIRAQDGNPTALVVDPWPFAVDEVEVFAEGRRLRGRFDDEAAMRDALAQAEPVTLRSVLKAA